MPEFVPHYAPAGRVPIPWHRFVDGGQFFLLFYGAARSYLSMAMGEASDHRRRVRQPLPVLLASPPRSLRRSDLASPTPRISSSMSQGCSRAPALNHRGRP